MGDHIRLGFSHLEGFVDNFNHLEGFVDNISQYFDRSSLGDVRFHLKSGASLSGPLLCLGGATDRQQHSN